MTDKLADLIYCACRNYDEYEDSFHENGMSPVESFEDFVADCLIENGVTVNEWRPASEPPKEAGYYLVAVKNEHGRKYTKSAYYHGNGHWFANQDITHWMPLPKPPKGETE